MARDKGSVLASLFLVLACASGAMGQEKHIQKADLPAAVQKAADEQSKGATVQNYSSEVEDGKLEYEVEMVVAGHEMDFR